MPAPALSVVLPIYNEERTLESTFALLLPFLEQLGLDDGASGAFEVVCVDDGSTDSSPEILEKLEAEHSCVRVLGLISNQGKGAAVRTGMLAAKGKRSIFMDADLSTPLEEIPRVIGALESGYDVVLGNRRSPGSNVTRRQPKLREFFGRGFTLLTRTFLVPGVQDFTCGFKGFTYIAAQKVFTRSTLNGWAFDAELVVIAHIQKLRLVQVPVLWRHEDDTKVRLVSAIFGSLFDLSRIFIQRLQGHYK
ncbi:MAG: dolichyl-phosphate beta-glucosyltransferase [Planctomycetota bacterium]|jgi:dolichyl-phosphate beta-glucosyltransferase